MDHALLGKLTQGRTDLVFQIVADGASPSGADAHGTTLMEWCAYHGDVSALRFLQSRGASLALLGDNFGLDSAAFHGHWQLVQFLLEQGADATRASPTTGETALHNALCKANRPVYEHVVRLLLIHGADPDASDVTEGTTVHLPIFYDGARFYFGDAHALQGDGEIAGSGLETTRDVTFRFDLIKGRAIRWPRVEDATHIMVAGSVRPLVDAFRIAQVELIEWLVADDGFDTLEADQGVSQGGTSRIANVVDPNDTVVAKFPKAALPPRVARP